jgi:chromosome segregation ATPase
MNDSTDISPQQPEGKARTTTATTNAQVNPSLSASLRENYEAVQEDLRQANELAANLENQLAGKSKEALHLKFLFEQTKAHLGHMQDGIVAMRMERHKLANEAMRAMGLDLMLARVTAERDRLKNELDGVIEALTTQNSEKSLHFDKRDHRIAELTFEVMKLRQEMEELRRNTPRPNPVAPVPRERPLKTSAEEFMKDEAETDGLEIVPTERVGGRSAKA